MYAFGLHLLGLRKRRKIMELTLYTLKLFFKSPISVISFGKKYLCIKAIPEEKLDIGDEYSRDKKYTYFFNLSTMEMGSLCESKIYPKNAASLLSQ